MQALECSRIGVFNLCIKPQFSCKESMVAIETDHRILSHAVRKHEPG